MNKFDRFILGATAAAACLASGSIANATVALTATGVLKTYVDPGRPYSVTLNFNAIQPSLLHYIEYFGAVDASDFVADYQLGPYSGAGSYTPPATFGGRISLAYALVPQAPEPAPWAMMLAGFAAIGLGIRAGARGVPRTA